MWVKLRFSVGTFAKSVINAAASGFHARMSVPWPTTMPGIVVRVSSSRRSCGRTCCGVALSGTPTV
jgi:hypothetical protein